MVIVINSVIGGFSLMDLVWLAASIVPLQVFEYSCTEWLVKNEATNAQITCEKIVIIMINLAIPSV